MKINMSIVLLGIGLAIGVLSAQGQVQLVAGWNFNDNDLLADHGTGTLTVNGISAQIFLPVGSTLNHFGSDTAGNALSYAAVTTDNGGTFTLRFATTGLDSPVLTYAVGAILNGFSTVQWAYSTNGSSFTNFGSGLSIPTITSTADISLMQVHTVNLTSVVGTLANQSDVYLRGTFTGLTSLASAALVLDNIQVNATTIPEPATVGLWLGGMVLVCALARRRRIATRSAD